MYAAFTKSIVMVGHLELDQSNREQSSYGPGSLRDEGEGGQVARL